MRRRSRARVLRRPLLTTRACETLRRSRQRRATRRRRLPRTLASANSQRRRHRGCPGRRWPRVSRARVLLRSHAGLRLRSSVVGYDPILHRRRWRDLGGIHAALSPRALLGHSFVVAFVTRSRPRVRPRALHRHVRLHPGAPHLLGRREGRAMGARRARGCRHNASLWVLAVWAECCTNWSHDVSTAA